MEKRGHHMEEDLQAEQLALSTEEIRRIENDRTMNFMR
jgi:hypothetical protein